MYSHVGQVDFKEFSSLRLDRGNSSDLNWYKCSLLEGVLDRFQMTRLKMGSEGSVGYNAEINKI